MVTSDLSKLEIGHGSSEARCMDFRPHHHPDRFSLGENWNEKSPSTVLVVDDDEELRSLMITLLSRDGYRALGAQNGLIAQAIFLSERPALVVSDLDMPVCDGWELLAFFHAQFPAVPVLLISGKPLGRKPEIEGWAAGFLPKPFNGSRFRLAIGEALTRADSR
jgi:DNA-binding response OmpR family regulator